MLVRELMKPSLTAATPMMTLSDVAEQMDAFGIDCLPVVDDDRLAGMITDRTLLHHLAAHPDSFASTPARRAMLPDPPRCFDDDSDAVAAKVMAERDARRLLVLDRDGHSVGVLARGDLVPWRARTRNAMPQSGRLLPPEVFVDAYLDYYGL